MYKPCPLCRKKKPHYHKGCNETTVMRQLYTPIQCKPDEKKK